MFDLFHELRGETSTPDRIVISNGNSQVSLLELRAQVEALRCILESKTSPSVTLLALPGGPQFTAVLLASLGAGSVVAPIPPCLRETEARDYLDLIRPDIVVVESVTSCASLITMLEHPTRILSLEDSSGRHQGHEVLGWHQVMEGLHEATDARGSRFPQGTAMVQFTSGSLSQPKGILISHANLMANQRGNATYLTGFDRADVFCPIPQFQAMGGAVMLEHLLTGSGVHMSNRFVLGEDLARMNRFGCRALLASPNYLRLLLRFGALTPQHLPDLEVVVLGTAAVDPALVAEIQTCMPRLEIHVRYGLSESVGTATRHVILPGMRMEATGMVGTAVAGTMLAPTLGPPSLGDPSEILLQAPTVAIGEIQGLDEWRPIVDESGYLHTGDLGYRDDEGQLHLRGRRSAFLKSNGHKISPFEIESVLRSHEEVQEVVVIGVPDPISGERVVACLEGASGCRTLGSQELQAHCLERLSAHKIPKEFNWLSPLPRTAAGKPDRRRILSLVSDSL